MINLWQFFALKILYLYIYKYIYWGIAKSEGNIMGIGPNDQIDRLLAKKYQEKQVNNMSDIAKLTMTPEKYWEAANDFAQMQKIMLKVQSTFKKQVVTRPALAKVTA
jgi:hypothetical protein